jgi:hypothetical protein
MNVIIDRGVIFRERDRRDLCSDYVDLSWLRRLLLNRGRYVFPLSSLFQYTTLFAGDDEENREVNHKFIVQRNIATSVSRTIKDMFDGPLSVPSMLTKRAALKKRNVMQRGCNR